MHTGRQANSQSWTIRHSATRTASESMYVVCRYDKLTRYTVICYALAIGHTYVYVCVRMYVCVDIGIGSGIGNGNSNCFDFTFWKEHLVASVISLRFQFD